MAKKTINNELKKVLLDFLKKNRKTELVTIYLVYLEKIYEIHPVLFAREKKIYLNMETLIEKLDSEEKLCRETELTIQLGQQSVNEETKRIYICPFTGKVFGDNTHPDPQDAIYDWVSRCPENTERVGGLKAKRFYISEDPDVIKSYIPKERKTIHRTVYSSAITGKLFNSKKAVLEDFKKNHTKPMTLVEVQNQNRYEIDSTLLSFLQKELSEEKITTFVEALAQHEEFDPYLNRWLAEKK